MTLALALAFASLGVSLVAFVLATMGLAAAYRRGPVIGHAVHKAGDKPSEETT